MIYKRGALDVKSAHGADRDTDCILMVGNLKVTYIKI